MRKRLISLSVAILLGIGLVVTAFRFVNRSEAPETVVLLGIDGMAWEMVAPLLEGSDYPSVDWGPSEELVGEAGWERLGRGGTATQVERAARGALPLVAAGIAAPRGIGRHLAHDGERASRYIIRARVEGTPDGVPVSLVARFRFSGAKPPQMSGNNESVWRTGTLEAGSVVLSLEIHPPTTVQGISIELLAYAPTSADDLERGRPLDRSAFEAPALVVTSVTVTPGRLNGLPEGGFPVALLRSAANRLPHLSRLMQTGSVGYLDNFEPAVSPVIWTSAVTGRSPERHGIQRFLTPAPGVTGMIPVSSAHRAVPALWNIITDYGNKSSGLVSWWATWPAESIRGFIVSDHANDAALEIFRDRRQLPSDRTVSTAYHEYDTFPRHLLEEIRQRFTAPDAFSRASLERFIPDLDDATWDRFRDIQGVDERQRLSFLKYYYAKDMSTIGAGLPLLREQRPDFWAIYLNGADALQHMFWHWEDPDLYPRVDRDEAAMFGRIVEHYYELIDELIGHVLEAAGPNAAVFVVSDHGIYGVDFMQSGENGPYAGHRWRSPGVLVASGRGIREGRYVEAAHVVDLAPTILYLLDYPVARNLEGRVMTELLTTAFLTEQPLKSVDSYRWQNRTHVEPSQFDEEIKARLRALGYIR